MKDLNDWHTSTDTDRDQFSWVWEDGCRAQIWISQDSPLWHWCVGDFGETEYGHGSEETAGAALSAITDTLLSAFPDGWTCAACGESGEPGTIPASDAACFDCVG